MPSVTVIIPCYNQAHFLQDCLESVRRQSFDDWEVIIVDDASKIGDVNSVAQKFRDPRIKIVRHSNNKGLGAARNTGFRLANSDLVLPLDSDDLLHEDFLKLTVEALNADPQADCVFTDFQLFGQMQDIWHFKNLTPADMSRQQWITGAGALMRKEIWADCGGYCEDEIFRFGNEDWDFWIAVAEKSIRAIHIPRPLYYYRRFDGSMSITSLRHHDHLTRLAIYRRHPAFFDSNNAKRSFLATGYLNSSIAKSSCGRNLQSLSLAGRGLFLVPVSGALWRQLFSGLIPQRVSALLRAVLGKIRRLRQWPKYLFAAGRKSFWDKKANDIHLRYGSLVHDHECISRMLASLKAARVLDVGCGSGRLFPVYTSLALKEVVAQDISGEALKLAKARCDKLNIVLLPTPVEELRFPDLHFDIAICNRVLQHIPPVAIASAVKAICRLSRYVYVNELSSSDDQLPGNVMFLHDYVGLFERFGFVLKDEGFIESEQKNQQHWRLFQSTSSTQLS